MLRAPIFLITYLVGKESIKLALGAALAQFIFRFFFAGVGGALIQSFRRVEPPWKALFTILLVVPLDQPHFRVSRPVRLRIFNGNHRPHGRSDRSLDLCFDYFGFIYFIYYAPQRDDCRRDGKQISVSAILRACRF